MALRDRYVVRLVCPACGKRGKAEVSENDHRSMTEVGLAVERLPRGFETTLLGADLHQTRFGCIACKKEARRS